MSCSLNSGDRLAIQDGSVSEAGPQQKWNPSAHLFSCHFHIKQELVKKGASGKTDSDVYSECVKRSKRSKQAVEQRCNSLSAKCTLRKLPKARLFPSHLPHGVGTHGNTTGNVVEVSHCMMEAVRMEPSLYKSIRTAVEVLHRQGEKLREEYINATAATLGSVPHAVAMTTEAPSDMLPPSVNREFHDSLSHANKLSKPIRRPSERPEDPPTFTVFDPRYGDTLVVSPSELCNGNYEKACACLDNANKSVMCIHVQRTIHETRANRVLFVKPWQKVRASRQSHVRL